MPGHRQLFLQHVAQTSTTPLMLEVVHAEGIKLTTADGRQYTDLISGISVSNIGHRHPAVLSAVREQLHRYMHVMVYGEYVQAPQVKLAALLSQLTPGIDNYYFVNSGSEAIEGIIKLARKYTGRKKIVACRNAYHGSTTGALSLMDNALLTEPFSPLLPEVEFITFNDTASLSVIDNTTACVIIEVVQGEAGAIVPDESFLRALQDRCLKNKVLLAADEIQTGFGRTGALFAFIRHSLRPDIIAIAKGMGGGMPIGAFGASREIMQCLSFNPSLGHITTFGGHPVSCAAACATIETLLDSGLINEVKQKEKLIREMLRHDEIVEITGEGLLLGVRFRSEEKNRSVINRCISNGIVTDWFLYAPDKMRIAPPLTIKSEELTDACTIIIKSIEEDIV